MATAIVTAGAGARGAYEAGVLSVVLPTLLDENANEEVVLLGTSAGAINTAIVAGVADQSPARIAEKLARTWSGIDVEQVFEMNLRSIATYLGEAAGLPLHVYSLLDTRPLEKKVCDPAIVDWAGLSAVVNRSTWLKAAGVVATEVATSHSVVFLQGSALRGQLPDKPSPRGIRYRPTTLTPQHILASSAIPIAFPAVQIEGLWYVDGGVRLNTPISPAIDVLTKVFPGKPHRMIIVSTDPDPSHSISKPMASGRPDVIDEAASVLHSALVDRVAEDVRSLRRVNAAVRAGTGLGPGDPRTLSTTAQPALVDLRPGGQTFEEIEHCYFGPGSRGLISGAARDVFHDKYGRFSLRSSPFKLISRLLGGSGPSRDELLSFLLFDSTFLTHLVDMGQTDARDAIAHFGGLPWSTLTTPQVPPA